MRATQSARNAAAQRHRTCGVPHHHRQPAAVQRRHCVPRAGASGDDDPPRSDAAPGRRALLGGAAASLLAAPVAAALIGGAAAPAAHAAVTLKIQSKTKLRPAQMKGGYVLQIPDSYSVAYDRSDSTDPTQFFAGNFKTFETVSISKFPLADLGLQQLEGVEDGSLGGLTLDEVVDKLLADTRDNQSTFGFKVLAKQARPAQPSGGSEDAAAAEGSGSGSSGSGSSGGGSGSAEAFWDIEYVHQICRGLINEESGGRRRCIAASGDRELQVVSRHYVATFTFRGPYMYFVKASAPTEEWQGAAALLLASAQSFQLPPRGDGRG